MTDATDTPDLAALIGSLDDETSLVAMSALDQLWSDKHSCENEECWGYRGYPADWFRRMLTAAIEAVGKDRPVSSTWAQASAPSACSHAA